MVQANATAVTMLGLPGFVVLAVEVIDGEIETTVEMTKTTAWCSRRSLSSSTCSRVRGGHARLGCPPLQCRSIALLAHSAMCEVYKPRGAAVRPARERRPGTGRTCRG